MILNVRRIDEAERMYQLGILSVLKSNAAAPINKSINKIVFLLSFFYSVVIKSGKFGENLSQFEESQNIVVKMIIIYFPKFVNKKFLIFFRFFVIILVFIWTNP